MVMVLAWAARPHPYRFFLYSGPSPALAPAGLRRLMGVLLGRRDMPPHEFKNESEQSHCP